MAVFGNVSGLLNFRDSKVIPKLLVINIDFLRNRLIIFMLSLELTESVLVPTPRTVGLWAWSLMTAVVAQWCICCSRERSNNSRAGQIWPVSYLITSDLGAGLCMLVATSFVVVFHSTE